jgi:serine/threonine protein kinase
VLEYASEGSIAGHQWPDETERRRKLAMYLFQQVITAIECCHSKDLVHRDISLESTLLSVENQEDGLPFLAVKISDFGMGPVPPDAGLCSRVSKTLYMAPVWLPKQSHWSASAYHVRGMPHMHVTVADSWSCMSHAM